MTQCFIVEVDDSTGPDDPGDVIIGDPNEGLNRRQQAALALVGGIGVAVATSELRG